jgi:hypothetical protein
MAPGKLQGLELDSPNQVLTYADVNLLHENINRMKNNAEFVLQRNKEIYADITKYMDMPH